MYINYYLLQFKTGGEYTLVDDYRDDTLASFFNGGQELQNLKDYVAEMENHSDFEYLSLYSNPLGMGYNESVPESVYAYGDKSVSYYGARKLISVNALEVSGNAVRHFGFDLPETMRYAGEDAGELPVLLGAEYAGVYVEGDTFPLMYFGMDFMAVVQEVLPEGMEINRRKETTILDNYIIVPFVECQELPITDAERRFQAISYSCRANGDAYLDADYSFGSFRKEIRRLAEKYGLPPMVHYQLDVY